MDASFLQKLSFAVSVKRTHPFWKFFHFRQFLGLKRLKFNFLVTKSPFFKSVFHCFAAKVPQPAYFRPKKESLTFPFQI